MENVDDSALIIQALEELIRPFSWPFRVVPKMISKLADLVCSPFPLITGVSSEVWEQHCEDKEDEMNEEAAIFFLETNELRT